MTVELWLAGLKSCVCCQFTMGKLHIAARLCMLTHCNKQAGQQLIAADVHLHRHAGNCEPPGNRLLTLSEQQAPFGLSSILHSLSVQPAHSQHGDAGIPVVLCLPVTFILGSEMLLSDLLQAPLTPAQGLLLCCPGATGISHNKHSMCTNLSFCKALAAE